MRRSPVGLPHIAGWHNLAAAFHRAALGKGTRPEVQGFAAHLAQTSLCAVLAAVGRRVCAAPDRRPDPQAGYSGALAIMRHADATAWHREQLRRVPVASNLVAL